MHHNNIFSSYSGYLLFNTPAQLRKNQGPRFGENYVIAKNVFNLHASSQSSPKINHMLITSLTCIQRKSSRFLSPVSTDHIGGRPTKKKPAFLQSCSAKASSTNNVTFDSKPTEARTHFLT